MKNFIIGVAVGALIVGCAWFGFSYKATNTDVTTPTDITTSTDIDVTTATDM